MTGGTASSTTLGTQINNMDGVVINSDWNVNGSVGNGPISQDAFAQATGGTFSLGLNFQNLQMQRPLYVQRPIVLEGVPQYVGDQNLRMRPLISNNVPDQYRYTPNNIVGY